MNSRRCQICNVDVHRASYNKHLRSKKHLENIKQNDMIIPERLIQEPIENKINKIYNPQSLKQLARNNIKLDDKQLNKELARRMINPYYSTDRNLKVAYKINLDNHNINHAISKLTITPTFQEFGIEFRFINKILKELSVIYARLINQYKFRYQTVFSARFVKQDEDDQLLDETEFFMKLNINQNFTESDLNKIDIKSPLEHQIQQQEMEDSGWRFDKKNSMTIYFYKTVEINGSNYIKIPLRSNAILNIENNDKYCFLWSILAYLHPCNNHHPNRVSNYRQYFNELNILGFDFTKGFKCSDVHNFNEINKFTVKTFELNFYQDQNQWKHKLIPIEVSKNDSDKVIDLAIYKNHYVLIEKLDVFLGDHNKKYICRRCLSSYTSKNMITKHKQKCGEDITSIKTSSESYLNWNKHFHKNLIFFGIYADFEADNEKDNSIIGNKTTNNYKQNPVLNGYHIVSELEDVLKSDVYKSHLGYNNVDWFVDEVIKSENNVAFCFENTKKDTNMKDEDEEDYRNNNVRRFCEQEILSDKVRDHCHLTGDYRGPAHSKCNINVTQKQSNFIPFIFHNFSNYECHMFFKKLVNRKKDKVDYDIIPKTNEEYISVTYGCIRFIDSYRSLSSGLDSSVKTLVDNDHKKLKNLKKEIVGNDEILDIVNKIVEEDKSIKDLKKDYPNEINKLEEALLNYMGENDLKTLKTGFPDKWKYLTKKLAYPYEHFNSIDDYQKPVDNLEKKDFFSKCKNECPDDEEIERTKEIIKLFDITNREELTEIYLKSDVLLLACVFEKFTKVSINEFKINPLYCVSLPGYTWQCGLKYTGINLQTLQDKDMILLVENNIRRGIASVMGDRYIKSDENKKKLYIDANNLYGHSMSEPLPYDEINFDKNVKLEDILNTPDDNDIGYFVEADLIYPDNIKKKTKKFPFAPVNKKINPDNFNDYMKEIKPDTYIQTSKLICDWSDKKNYLILYRMLKF